MTLGTLISPATAQMSATKLKLSLSNIETFMAFAALTSSNVTLKSTGTNGWTGIPEFSSNLLSTSWSVVPNYTNTFANGTNTTVFNRLEAICGSNVFLRVKNTSN